ncbi:MAG: hypothetical protein ACR2O7_16460 [Parasphingorhabdus sp.]
MDGENILTIDQLVSVFPAFGEKTVRWWIYNGKSNGFEACLIRIGSRIYIDRKRFVEWVKSHRPVRDVPRERSEELEDVE